MQSTGLINKRSKGKPIAVIYLAPAAGGKTTYAVDRAREASRDLTRRPPRVIVPGRLLAAAFNRRLAVSGGALGVRVGTFRDFYQDVLDRAGLHPVQLSEPVQKQILRRAAARSDLQHYRALQGMPGFAEVMADLIRELKAGLISPGDFYDALVNAGRGPRLLELAGVYRSYQDLLEEGNFVDNQGAGWLALDALMDDQALGGDWPLVLADGFDDFTPLQLEILTVLDQRVETLEITLTGGDEPDERELVHRRFNRTRQKLVETLSPRLEVLPLSDPGGELPDPLLRGLERTLFTTSEQVYSSGSSLAMAAAPDREAEVRLALRRLKERVVQGGLSPRDCAVLVRNLEPYRPYLKPTAEEFGLPLRLLGGFPVLENPAVAALMDLLRLAAPGSGRLAWQGVVEAWRSPYFDWAEAEYEGEPLAIQPGESEILAWAARWGSVLGGDEQWREIFEILSGLETRPGPWDEDYPEVPALLPIGEGAAQLGRKLTRFAEYLTPLPGKQPLQEHTRWLENLIGEQQPETGSPAGLGMVKQILNAPPELAGRDLNALQAFKGGLRGLVWGEQAAGLEPVTFSRYLEELEGALAGATYQVDPGAAEDAVLAADITQVRGLSFRAAAVLGLAEGEFPAPAAEDYFLRDEDRAALREGSGLPLRPSTESAEAGYFYEAVTRARDLLLLTRPRIADNGAPWQPSPYWEEVLRRVDAIPRKLTTRTAPAPDVCASWSEYFETAAREGHRELWSWAEQRRQAASGRIDLAARILAARTESRNQAVGPYDGDLSAYGGAFAARYGPDQVWSASRLETYRSCPYFFFTSSVLNLEAAEPPREGLDARQLGNLYHRILEELYRQVGENAGLEDLLLALPEVAGKILEDAPRVEGFRETAWWKETRQIILKNLRRSIEVLETLDPGFGFYRSEQSFGISPGSGPPLVVNGPGGDSFRLRGFIDRVDRDADGRVRVVDYKTSSPYGFTAYALRRGKKLQLPLYALAAQEALSLGDVAEGFYFHVRHAEPSSLQLGSFSLDGSRGPGTAMEHGVKLAWEAVRGARSGRFVPEAPADGCPSYCPAAGYCWHYDPVYW